MHLVACKEEVNGPGNEANAPEEEEDGARLTRRFPTGTTASGRIEREASLITAILNMGLDLNPDNAKIHEALLQEYLPDLEDNNEPHNYYISDLKGQVSRAVKEH